MVFSGPVPCNEGCAAIESLELDRDTLCQVVQEIWKLNHRITSLPENSLPRSVAWSVRKLSRLVEESGFTCVDLAGRELDSGFQVDILDSEYDAALSPGVMVVKEMVKPIILRNDRVVSRGEVIVAKGAREGETGEEKRNE